jgi:hypothetical protein
MKGKQTYLVLGLVLLLAAVSGTALANDQIISTVIPAGQPTPIIEDNGAASGNIRLNYTVVGTQFPCGPFAQFYLGLAAQLGTGNGVYPADLALAASGKGTPVQLSPSPASFSVGGVGWSGSALVTIHIDCSKLSGSPEDGDVIDGQMNVSATVPSGHGSAHLDTITTVQVHIKLVFPDPEACLKLYSFESGQDDGVLLSAITVNAKRSGEVKSTQPGQASVDALVANTCTSPRSFDLLVSLDPQWQTNPSGNPGNATFVYTTAGEFDVASFDLAAFGAGAPRGQLLCLPNVMLEEGDSFLARIHSSITSGIFTSDLPIGGEFAFSATLYTAGTACTAGPLGASIVGPHNPAISTLPFTIR